MFIPASSPSSQATYCFNLPFSYTMLNSSEFIAPNKDEWVFLVILGDEFLEGGGLITVLERVGY